MKTFLSTLTFSFLVFTSTTFAQTKKATCLPEERINKLTKDISFYGYTYSNGSKTFDKADLCDETSLPYKVFSALILLQDISLDVGSKTEIDQNILGSSPYSFFSKRIQKVVFDYAQNPACDQYTAAYVLSKTPTTYICPHSQGNSIMGIASTLVHESRHVDGYGHVNCKEGALKDWLGCDPNYEYRGSYAVSAEFFIKLSRTSSIPQETRTLARAYAIDKLVNHFNTLPLGIKPSVALLNPDHTLTIFDGKTESGPLNIPVEAGSIMTIRAGFITIFNPIEGLARSYVYTKTPENTAGETVQEFKEMTSGERATIKDIFYGEARGDYSCQLTSENLKCLYQKEKYVINVAALRPVRFIDADGIISFVSEDGSLYVGPKTIEKLKDADASVFVRSNNPNRLQTILSLQKGLGLGLNFNGEVLAFKRWNTLATPYAPLKGRTFKAITGPFYYSKKMEEI